MKRLALASIAILALTAPTLAAGSIFIPIGPPKYTPQPDKVISHPSIPQDPTITETEVVVKPATHESGSSPTFKPNGNQKGFWNEKCQTIAYVNADCTALSLNPGGSGSPAVKRIDVKTTLNPDIIVPDTYEPQDPTCSQPGISIPGGWGSRDC